MRETGALVIIREDEHLGLPGKSSESSRRVEDSVAVAFETGSERVWFLANRAIPGTNGLSCSCGQVLSLMLFTLDPIEYRRNSDPRSGVSMCVRGGAGSGVGMPGGCPRARTFAEFVLGEVLDRHVESLSGRCDSVPKAPFTER